MPFYDINTNLPGVKKVMRSEPAAVVSSSTLLSVFAVALDPAQMRDTTDGYEACQSNTDTSAVVILASEAVNANEWAGQWVWVGSGQFSTPEVRQIVSHPSAALSASLTLTVDLPFSVAPTSGESANVRPWEDFLIPSFHSGVNDFASKFIGVDASGNLDWTNCENAFYTIVSHKANGGAGFYVVPVPLQNGASATDLTEQFVNVWSNSVFKSRMLQLSPQPHVLCVPKQPSLPVSLSVSQWASVDSAMISYATSRATDDTADTRLREMFCVLDAPTSVLATNVTYRTTTLNATSERAEMVMAQYLRSSQTPGSVQVVAGSPARCGIINRVSVSAPESWGHAMEGANYTQVSDCLKLVSDLSPTDQLTAIANAIDPLVSLPGEGFWFEEANTQAKSPSDVGADPLEYSHIAIGRAQVWNTLQRILAAAVSEPNNAVVRSGLLARIDSVMRQMAAKGLVAAFQSADVTSDEDVGSGTARFELAVEFNGAMRFIELTLSAAVGQ